MLFHVSVEADNPQQVAEALAQIWGGEAHPFPPVGVGSWVGPAADQPAGARDGSDALVAEAVDHRRGRGRPGRAGEADRPARRHTGSHDAAHGETERRDRRARAGRAALPCVGIIIAD